MIKIKDHRYCKRVRDIAKWGYLTRAHLTRISINKVPGNNAPYSVCSLDSYGLAFNDGLSQKPCNLRCGSCSFKTRSPEIIIIEYPNRRT